MARIRFATASLAAMLFFSGSLFAQAAAEAALSHGLSSSAGSTLGKTLGQALGNAAGQVGGKLGQQTSTTPRQRARAPQAVAPKNVTATAVPVPDSAPPAPGSLIVSIQGADVAPKECLPVAAVTNSESQIGDPKAAVPTADENCTAKSAQEAESHPAVLNLPAPK